MKKSLWCVLGMLSILHPIISVQAQDIHKPVVIREGRAQQVKETETVITPRGVFSKSTDAYSITPNYIGAITDSKLVSVSGSISAPDTNPAATAVFEKFSNSQAFNASASLAYKSSTSPFSRATAAYGECADPVGGTTSFCEGGRFQSTITGGANGSGYGLIGAAGATPSANTPMYLVGVEGNTINLKGPDASTYGSFNRDRFSAAIVATNGCDNCGSFKADAGIVINPYNEIPFRTGILIGDDSIDDTAIAFGNGLSIVNGLDMHLSNPSYSSVWIPNNSPIRGTTVNGSGFPSLIRIDNNNNLVLGDTGVVDVITNSVIRAPRLSITADTSPLDYNNSRAKLVYQHRDTANGATNELIPGAVLQFNATGNGTVNSSVELSQTIWQGQFNYMRKTGDGSAHTYTAIGELGAYGPGAYNELGLFQGEGTNTGSGLGTMSGVEMLLKDSPNGGTNTYSTKMQAVVGRIAKYNPTIRKSFNFYASSEGTLPPNAILGANDQGLASWQRGFDFTDLNFTTGQFGIAPNNTFLAWQKVNDVAVPVVGVNNADDVIIAATSTSNRVSITDSSFVTKLAVDQDASNPILLYADGTLKRVTLGAPDSGGAGYRMLRVAN